jgi:hypothetical protein
VTPIAEHQLQRVCVPDGSSTVVSVWPPPKMNVICIGDDRLFERIAGQLRIDQQMMMAGVFLFDAGRRDAHTGQAELDRQGRFDGVAVLQIDEIDLGILRRGRLCQDRRAERDCNPHSESESN